MAGWNGIGWPKAVAFALAWGVLVPFAIGSDAKPEAPTPRIVTTEQSVLRFEAEAEEQAGHWEKALDVYLKLYLSAGSSAELRDRIRHCFRQSSQFQRQRDLAFQQYVLNLPVNDVLNIYAEAVTKLSTLYVDQKRATPAKLFQLGVEELDRAFNDPVFRSRHVISLDESRIAVFRQTLRTTWMTRQLATVKDVRQASRELVAATHDEVGIRSAAAVVLELLCGACSGLDEYTSYVTPTADHADLASLIAEFANYGILVRIDAGELVIDDVVPNSWAATNMNPPIQKSQRIVRVNNRSTLPVNPAILHDAFRSGTPFELAIETAMPEMGMVPTDGYRLPVPAPTVFGPQELLKDGVGYIRLSSFRESTPIDLEGKVLELRARGMRGLVLDVRGNPGGLFTAVVAVTQRFLPAGIVVTTQGQSIEFAGREFISEYGEMAWDFPVVLLVDNRTMSAAEVLSVALKDHARATLVGLPTFGKGVIQSSVRLQNGDGIEGKGGVLVLTVATVSGPRGGPLNGGVVPHVVEADPTRQLEIAILKATELANGRTR